QLEFGVAAAAALSPLLIALVRAAYIGAGGTTVLGLTAGTALRLAFAALVLGAPTVLMGGTLPAVTRAAEYAGDVPRRTLGVLYGVNTLGAVAGTLWTTFVSLEVLGARATIWAGSVLNLGVALAAFALARRTTERSAPPAARDTESRKSERVSVPPPKRSAAKKAPVAAGQAATAGNKPQAAGPRAANAPAAAAPSWLALVAAAVVGFAFLLMELVWYRMLAPLLG